jgi:hypothetical protein
MVGQQTHTHIIIISFLDRALLIMMTFLDHTSTEPPPPPILIAHHNNNIMRCVACGNGLRFSNPYFLRLTNSKHNNQPKKPKKTTSNPKKNNHFNNPPSPTQDTPLCSSFPPQIPFVLFNFSSFPTRPFHPF